MSVLVITTGGTIGALPNEDPRYCPEIVQMPPDGRDLVREVLAGDLAAVPSQCISFEPRDSKLFDDEYRNKLLEAIKDAAERNILVTHGTDALLQTADYFYQKAPRDKTILLTGAMVPLANGSISDGFLNLKYSLEQLSNCKLAPGIYIVLCDYVNIEKQEGWQPTLYKFVPGKYEKYYNREDARFSRLRPLGAS